MTTIDKSDLSSEQRRNIVNAVQHFEKNHHRFQEAAKQMLACFEDDPTLRELIHFIKYRVKDSQSLSRKLERLARDQVPDIDRANLFKRVRDLAGVRIIHLHADQIKDLHPRIIEILKEQEYRLVGNPVAYCWDVDYENLFGRIGLEVKSQTSMYTTVHYDVLAHESTDIACELQVRSLADEVWGEVSHRVNYPTESPSEACRDQLKVLARLTSGCGRLVDSIFKTHGDAVAAERP